MNRGRGLLGGLKEDSELRERRHDVWERANAQIQMRQQFAALERQSPAALSTCLLQVRVHGQGDAFHQVARHEVGQAGVRVRTG